MRIYLVGGAVRDELLELPVAERDWVVVGATPEQMLELGYRRADAAFPVFIHPETGDEYALARTERKTGPGYKGFEVDAGPGVTLEQDLMRRDLTINALARDQDGNLIDVCNGREDLDNGLLRHITPAFSEDPVRLLRVARFAAKLGKWGFRIAHGTHGLMKKMAVSADLDHLRAERVWKEMERAMHEAQPWRFFEVLHRCGALARLIPELDAALGGVAGHGEEAGDGLAALKTVTTLSDDPVVRVAVALYPAAVRAVHVDSWLERVRAGREAAQLLRDLLDNESRLPMADDEPALLRLAGGLKSAQQPQRFHRFLLAGKAIWPLEMPRLAESLACAAETLQQKPAAEFYRQELSGAALGEALRNWREQSLKRRLTALRQKATGDGS